MPEKSRIAEHRAWIRARVFHASRNAVIVTLFLTACVANSQHPAPVVQYGVAGGAASAGMHTASKGETLWDIAQRYRVSMQDVIRINHLAAPYSLRPEQRLKLPAPREYTVKPGDTLSSIARMFDVSATETVRLNRLHPPYAAMAGQVLRLPPPPDPVLVPLPRVAGTQFSRAQVSQPLERADTERPEISGIPPAQLHVSSIPPLEDDPVYAPPAIAPGRVQAEALAPPPSPLSGMPPPSAPPAYNAQPAPVFGEPPLAQMQTPPPPPPAAPAMPSDVPPRAGQGFAWPVNGEIVSAYGPKSGGLHNDGINIKAAKGTPVRAAENGVVVYAGSQLKGFGNLVLVRHADRWMTAYAHLDSVAARKGQVLRKGEMLGTVGATGSVGGPQLHFEIRRGTEAINPAYYLGKASG